MTRGVPRDGLVRTLGATLAAAGMMLAMAGCSGAVSSAGAGKQIGAMVAGTTGANVLRIATSWPSSQQARTEREFLDWIARNQTQPVPGPIEIVWISVDADERLEPLSGRLPPADLLLGGPVSEYARLARKGMLAPLDEARDLFWKVARRSVIVLAGGRQEPPFRLAFDDPRTNAQTLAWTAGQLSNGRWKEGYARLVSLFGHASHRSGWRSGLALAAYERGEAEATLKAIARDDFSKAGDADPAAVNWDEGVAVCRDSSHPALARTFVRFLAETREIRSDAQTNDRDPDPSGLMADLLGATLIDAQDELISAWTILDRQRSSTPSSARAWLTEPPPWPPVSVERLQKRGGEDALSLVEDLAGQIAPDPALRITLLQSWLRPPRLIDDTLIAELSSAADGRLAREPRFRSWLRGMDGLGAPAISTSRARGIDRGICLGGRTLTINPSLNSLTRSGCTMIRVIIEGLVKRYGQVAAVDDASLEIAPGELACVLGPPGAGKSTLGRLLAGLEVPDDGEIYLDDRMVLALPPQERRVGMVFPDYALWPGMTVADNVAYPLKVQGMKAPERRQRVSEALTALRIDSLAGKRPEQLLPPQALRVAIARATVTRPDLLILDEPLEPFEPRSRDEAWDEIRKLRSELEVTTLLLTRVVSEAIAHADRLAVMDLGRIVQVGAPQDLYNNPADVFVARLLGPTNLLQGQVDSNGNDGRRDVVVRTPVGRLVARSSGHVPPQGSPVTISIRPETLSLGPSIPPDWNRFPGTIERIIFRGDTRQIDLRGPGDWPITARILQCHLQGLREGQSLTLSVSPDFVRLLPGKFAVGNGA